MYRRIGRLALGTALAVTFLMSVVGGASAHFNFALPEEWYMDVTQTNDVERVGVSLAASRSGSSPSYRAAR